MIILFATFALPLAVLAMAVANTMTALHLLKDLEDRK